DASVVPIRYAWTNHYGGESIPTDMYYSSLEGTWNENGNDVFGEWGDGVAVISDGVTFYPQIIVGRLPVRNGAEAEGYTDKAMEYMTAPAPGFAGSALLMAEILLPNLDGADLLDEAALSFPSHWGTTKLYESSGTMSREPCLAEINSGHCLTLIAGHGDAFRTSTAEGAPPYIQVSDFDTLSNAGRCGFVYALNCNNNAVDVDCVFRHYIANPGGGCIAAYATTRFNFQFIAAYLLEAFCDYFFDRGVHRFGDVCALHYQDQIPSAVDRDGSARWTVLTYMLFGDPVLAVYMDDPDTLYAVHAGAMTYGDSVYAVTVEDGGGPVECAVVVMTGERGEYGAALTDAGGSALLEYSPLGPGAASLVVSREGYLVLTDSVDVTGAGGRCYISGVSVDDGAGWTGNGDGEAGWGERVGLEVALVNGDADTAAAVTADLVALEGCSLLVDVELDGWPPDSLVHVGREGRSPPTMPFEVGVTDEVMGRAPRDYGAEYGCWLWLDGMGWHVRFCGEGDGPVAYRCSLEVYGEIAGYRGEGLGPEDILAATDTSIVLTGVLQTGSIEEGFDLLCGSGVHVVIHDGSQVYGDVGPEEVMAAYDVEFTGPAGDGTGVWFEIEIEDGGAGLWRDWFRVLVRDGALDGERIEVTPLSGDSLGVIYGVRNVGGGGLKDIAGVLRPMSGITAEDSVSTYGDLASREYAEGDGYVVRSTAGVISFEIYLTDAYGKTWSEIISLRSPAAVTGLRYLCGSDYVELAWDAGSDSLFRGFDVFRAGQQEGPYDLAGVVDGHARLIDDGLASEEDYFYYICVRDSMGNVSSPSETLRAWTGAPYQAGWPVGPTNVIYSSVCPGDLDGNGTLELAAGSKDHHLHVWEYDGVARIGWPRPTGDMVWSAPAIADLDGDPELEVVVGSNDGNLYAWNHDGSGLRMTDGFFRTLGGEVRAAPCIADIDGDFDFEIIAANTYGQVYVWHHEGTGYLQPNGFFAQAQGSIYGSPAIADVDGNLDLEIIVGTTGSEGLYIYNHDGSGYLNPDGLFASPGIIYCSIAVGDIDANGDVELVAGKMFSQSMVVYDHTGDVHPGWPQSMRGTVRSSPALAELDGDGKLDIVIGTMRTGGVGDTACVYVFSDDGSVRAGWPVYAQGDFESSPVVGDIDGDGEMEVVIGCTDDMLYAYNADGTRLDGWPRHMAGEIYSAPALCDIDLDGDIEVAVGGYDALMHVFDLSAPYDSSRMEWPKFCHDRHNSNLYGGPPEPGSGVNVPGGVPGSLTLMAYPSPAVSRVSVRLGVPSGAPSEYSIDIFDVRGRHVRNLLKGDLETGYSDLMWDLKDGRGRDV
ncbi:MAG: C25 family cysteine peptidase, partial [bacterium]